MLKDLVKKSYNRHKAMRVILIRNFYDKQAHISLVSVFRFVAITVGTFNFLGYLGMLKLPPVS